MVPYCCVWPMQDPFYVSGGIVEVTMENIMRYAEVVDAAINHKRAERQCEFVSIKYIALV